MRDLFLLSGVSACVSFTLSESLLFVRIRRWVGQRCAFLGRLLECGYCTGHWVALAFVLMTGLRWQATCITPLDLSLSWILVAWWAGLQWGVFCTLCRIAEK